MPSCTSEWGTFFVEMTWINVLIALVGLVAFRAVGCLDALLHDLRSTQRMTFEALNAPDDFSAQSHERVMRRKLVLVAP